MDAGDEGFSGKTVRRPESGRSVAGPRVPTRESQQSLQRDRRRRVRGQGQPLITGRRSAVGTVDGRPKNRPHMLEGMSLVRPGLAALRLQPGRQQRSVVEQERHLPSGTPALRHRPSVKIGESIGVHVNYSEYPSSNSREPISSSSAFEYL
jgi:hypothetical protein